MKRPASDANRLRDVADRIRSFDPTDALSVMAENSISCIVHTAAAYDRRNDDLAGTFHTNCVMPLSIIDAAAKNGVRAFINCSTFYPKYYSRMINYTLTKHQFAEYLPRYTDRMAVIDLTLGHVYGERDSADKFIPFVIRTLVGNAPELPLTGGKQKRKFIHVADAADACLKAATLTDSGMYRYDVCDDRKYTIADCVHCIQRSTRNTGTKLRFGALPYAADEIMDVRLSNSTLKKDTGWAPSCTFTEGIARVVASYQGEKE